MTAFAHHHYHQDSSDEKLPFYDNDNDNDDDDQEKNDNMKSEDLLRSCSYLYPIFFAVFLILGSILLIVTLTRTSPCLNHQHKQLMKPIGNEFLLEHSQSMIYCQSINASSTCLCPISMIQSETNPDECLSRSTRCLRSCQHNEHCHCYRLSNSRACYDVTQQWIFKQLQILPVESLSLTKDRSSLSWREELEQIAIDRSIEDAYLFFSTNQNTASVLYKDDDDYLLNERWFKFDQNSTEENLVYTQIDVETRSCRLSSILTNGSINHHSIHPCPGRHLTGAPYDFSVICDHILILWQGPSSLSFQVKEQNYIIHHHFQSIRPQLPVIIDPFHRYYSIYDDSMIEVKNLNGDVLGQFFTDIQKATKFDFIDQQGTLIVANRTHRQLFRSKDKNIWFDI